MKYRRVKDGLFPSRKKFRSNILLEDYDPSGEVVRVNGDFGGEETVEKKIE